MALARLRCSRYCSENCILSQASTTLIAASVSVASVSITSTNSTWTSSSPREQLSRSVALQWPYLNHLLPPPPYILPLLLSAAIPLTFFLFPLTLPSLLPSPHFLPRIGGVRTAWRLFCSKSMMSRISSLNNVVMCYLNVWPQIFCPSATFDSF